VYSNGGTATETLRNDTIYSESAEASTIELDQSAASGKLELNAYNTIAINAAGGHDVSASKLATITMSHSDYASPVGMGTITSLGGQVKAAPLFANALGGDFRELAGSPTIDAGLTETENGTLDFSGNARATGASTDIGALEFQPPPGEPPPVKVVPEHGSGTPPPAPVAPQITLARLTAPRFRAAARGAAIARAGRVPVGSTLTYRDSLAATTTIRILSGEAGHRSGHGCLAGKPRRHQKPCRRTRVVAALTRSDRAALNTLRISGRAGTRKLTPGSYMLTLTPATGKLTGATVTLSFRVVA